MTFDMETAITEKPKVTVYQYGQKIPHDPKRFSIQHTLERILSSNQLYVGYHPSLPPFSYFNNKNNLVGFNIALANGQQAKGALPGAQIS